ncbi:Uncharacterised protein [Acinetobacter baumannii]|nr:Uncharacterised protein [Acinetobacter baumannii]
MEPVDYYCRSCGLVLIGTDIKQYHGIDCPKCNKHKVKPETKKSAPLLTIVLDDINSVPTVHYKGEEITLKQRVSFDYKTNDDLGKYLTYIHIQRVASQGNTEVIQHNQPHDRDND